MLGYKTLVVDIDPQSNSTSGFGMKNESKGNTIYELLIDKKPARDCIEKTKAQPALRLRRPAICGLLPRFAALRPCRLLGPAREVAASLRDHFRLTAADRSSVRRLPAQTMR